MRINQLPDPQEIWLDVEEVRTLDYDLGDFCLMEGNAVSSIVASVKRGRVTVANETNTSNVISFDILSPTSDTGSDLVTIKVTFDDGQIVRLHWRIKIVDVTEDAYLERL